MGWQTPLNLRFNDHFRGEPGLAWLLTARPNAEHNFSLQLVRWFSTLLSIMLQKSRSTIYMMVRIQCASVPSLIKSIRRLTEPQDRWDTRWLCPWAGPPDFIVRLFWKWTYRDQWHVHAGCPSCHPTISVTSLTGTQNNDPIQGKSPTGLVLDSRSKDRCSLFAGSTTSVLGKPLSGVQNVIVQLSSHSVPNLTLHADGPFLQVSMSPQGLNGSSTFTKGSKAALVYMLLANTVLWNDIDSLPSCHTWPPQYMYSMRWHQTRNACAHTHAHY